MLRLFSGTHSEKLRISRYDFSLQDVMSRGWIFYLNINFRLLRAFIETTSELVTSNKYEENIYSFGGIFGYSQCSVNASL